MSGSRVLAKPTWNDLYQLTEIGRRELTTSAELTTSTVKKKPAAAKLTTSAELTTSTVKKKPVKKSAF